VTVTSTPTPMDPRMRERRIEVQRALGRRRLRVLLVLAGVVIAAGAAFLVIDSPFLDVDRVTVRGTHALTADDIRAAARVHKHSALLFVDTGAVAHRVEQLPWVEHASVARQWPGTVRISVTEYQPVAWAHDGNRVVLFAANGRAIARVDAAPGGTTEVRGVRVLPADGQLLAPPDATRVVTQLPPDLARRVGAIDVGGNGLALVLKTGGDIRLGNADDIAAKAAAALAVLQSHTTGACFQYLDVSTPSTPVLRRCP
jgi:cell division protein FtsQ